MKLLIMTLLILTSCAQTKPKVVRQADEFTPQTIEQKREKIKEVLANHNEFKAEEREKIEKVLMKALDKSEALRERESQLLQQVFNKTLCDKGTYNEIGALRVEMNKVYAMKSENIESTLKKLKDLVGIDPKNTVLSSEIGNIDVFRP